MSDSSDFIVAACVPLDRAHVSGDLERANALLTKHPEIAGDSIYTAAILGDNEAVSRFIAADPSSATQKGGPHEWDALTHLCFSRYLRLEPERSPGFVSAARSLLDAGANPNTGWWEKNHEPKPEWEGALYGAAGVAHNPELTRLLVERGADVNDGEVTYHVPEDYDNRALEIIVETGKLTPASLATMLVRKHDWHDYDGVVFLLEHGADPNFETHWLMTPLHHAIQRDNHIDIIKAALDHGGNLNVPRHSSPLSLAVRRGREDILKEAAIRGIPIELKGIERLIAACATDDAETITAITASEPDLVHALIAESGKLLAEFAGVGNTAGVGRLLDLGVPVDERYKEGDGYFGIAKDSIALHVAAWRARHDTVKLLIDRGAPIDAKDARGHTPLMMAVKACVDSYWMERRTPESVKALLDAGASADGIPLPVGYAEIDALLKAAAG